MNITWLGHSCFKLEEKINNEVVTIVTDPYDNKVGLRFPKTKANVVTVSHDHFDHNNFMAVSGFESESPFLVDRPGEYEIKGAFITGIGSYHDKKEGEERGKSTMFKIEMDGITVLHCGDLGTALSDAQLVKIGNVDIMLVPVGGNYTIDAKEAAEIVRQVEPRIVIPMHYKIPGLTVEVDGIEKFKKEMGGNGVEVLPKYKISKKDLPVEETKLIILAKD